MSNAISGMRALKEGTHAEHEAIEKQVPLTREGLDLQGYVAFLERAYGYYAPLEELVHAGLAGQGALADLDQRRKTPYLESDLARLGVDAERLAGLPRHVARPPATPSAAFGVLYVLEGATLGGRLIARHLAEHLPELPGEARRFLEPYGGDTGARWKSFGAALEAFLLRDDADLDEMLHAARATFTSYGSWLHG